MFAIVFNPHPFLGGGWGGVNLLPNFHNGGGLDRASIFRGGLLGKRGCNFYIKNKMKSEILMAKEVHKQKCFSLS